MMSYKKEFGVDMNINYIDIFKKNTVSKSLNYSKN